MSSKEWKVLPLEDCMEAIIDYRGKTPRKSSFGIPLITAKIVKGGRILEPTEFIPYEDYDERMSRGIPQAGDIVITTEAPLGEVGQLDDRKLSVGQRLITLRGKKDLLDNTYLKFLMMSEFVQNQLLARETGTTVSGIKQAELRKIDLLIPPLTTQRRIADILSALDEKIELNRQVNVTLEAMAQAIFREWFVDFNLPDLSDPKGLLRDQASLQAKESGENGSRQAGETFRVSGIPQGWRVGKLGDFGNIVCGKTPSKANSSFFGGEIPFIKIPDMHNSVFVTKTEDSLTVEGAISQKNKFLPPYSIVVSCIATVGLVAITSERSQTNQQINAIIPRDEHSSFYLYFCAKELDRMLKDLGSGGSATLNVNTSSFSNIDCVIPSDNVLKNFDKVVRPIFEQIKNNEQQTATLAALRDALLPKLMSGEIGV